MKWYNSVKVKMIGFFLFISIVFLISIVTAFFMMRENNLLQNASKEVALITSDILQDIRSKQVRAEETVLTLASVSSVLQHRILSREHIVTAILDSHKKNSLDVISGGIWFEPDLPGADTKEPLLFFQKTQKGRFGRVEKYPANFREMAFYTLAKTLSKGETAWTEVYTDPATHVDMITVVSPVYNANTFIGAASIDIAIKKSVQQNISRHMENAGESYLMMLDRKGNFIIKSDHLNTFADEANIFHIHNSSFKRVMEYIKPVLEKGTDKSRCYSGSSPGNVPTITYIPSVAASTSINGDPVVLKESICLIEDDPVLHSASILAIYHFPKTQWNIVVGISKNQVLAHYDTIFYRVLSIIVLLTIFATILGYFILRHIFVKPIEHINRQLQQAIAENAETSLLTCMDKGEIGMLVDNLNQRTVNLIQSKERENKEHQLRLAHEETMIQQSKMAVMGEMMDSVAHQWKQPLNALTLYSELIRNDFEEGNVDQAYIEKFRKDIQLQIDHMVNTLDEFRSFFRPDKEKQSFKLIDVVNSALFLAKDDILKHHILVKIEQQDEIVIDGYPNEFKHLILNIINNAKDAFIDNDVKQRLIRISLISSEEGKRMEICDNAGGIPETVIDKLFEANVTTKEEGKGTGIGLYMSRRIAQKHHAQLQAENRDGGACFIVYFDCDIQENQEADDLPAK